MKESEIELYKIIGEAGIDVLMGVFNVMTFGVAMNITDFVHKVIQHGKGIRDAHYALQVKAFLETPTEVTQEEFKKFIEDNPDHQRLGLEVFKILEQTVIEEQAKMLSKAFSLWIKGKYAFKYEFDADVYLIKNLDAYLFSMFKEIAKDWKNKNNYFKGNHFKHLEILDLIKEIDNPMWSESDIKPSYQVSTIGIQFYERIVKEL